MVALGAGRLTQTSLLSLHHLTELRFLHITPEAIHIGANTTFTDIRRNPAIADSLPLLTQAASWTGSIANQNRATLGGNLANASPAADTPPALLVYNASIKLISSTGERTLPYADFHLAYKRTALRCHPGEPAELLHSVTIPRIYARPPALHPQSRHPQRPGHLQDCPRRPRPHPNQTIEQIRLAAASLADRPLRLHATERALTNASLAPADFPATLRRARAALASESHPIDDIRSTARYRSAVAANLLEQFLHTLLP